MPRARSAGDEVHGHAEVDVFRVTCKGPVEGPYSESSDWLRQRERHSGAQQLEHLALGSGGSGEHLELPAHP
jgi:hypothetical protein